MVYEKLSKNALRCMYAAGAVTGVILLAVIGAVDYFWVFPEDIDAGKWISLAAVLLILADVCVSPWFRFCRYRYGIDEECIDIEEGYLFVKRHIVPIERLHKLEMKTGPLDRGLRGGEGHRHHGGRRRDHRLSGHRAGGADCGYSQEADQ